MAYLNVPDNVKVQILATYGRTPRAVLEDIDSIKEWHKKQPHLPRIINDKTIEKLLIVSKCSVEVTKQKIEMYYQVRTLFPDIYANSNPQNKLMQQTADLCWIIPMPKLTKNLHRVIVYKITSSDADQFDPVACISHIANLSEIYFNESFVLGVIAVCDWEDFGLGHISKISPILMQKARILFESVYTAPIIEVHHINCPTLANGFLKLVKSYVKLKVADRIYVHKNLQSLYEHVPKNVLPIDLGGDRESLAELNDRLKDYFIQNKDHFNQLDHLKVDESLRPAGTKSLLLNDLFGFSGNFKQLDLD